MPVDEIELEAEEKMEKALDVLRHELRMVRTGRASTALVEHVKVEVASYGSVMDLRQLAALSTPEGNMILIKPFDPTTIKDIHKGLEKANLGITPMSDGKVIRLPIPPLSGERREQLAQQVKQMAETQRIAIRNIRRDANKHLDSEENDSDHHRGRRQAGQGRHPGDDRQVHPPDRRVAGQQDQRDSADLTTASPVHRQLATENGITAGWAGPRGPSRRQVALGLRS